MSGTDSTPGDGITSDLPMAVAQILGPDGTVAGTGFLVAEGVVVTCAHVVEAAGGGPGGQVLLAFPHVVGADRVPGTVPGELWRSVDAEDVAFVRLSEPPAGTRTLPLGPATGRRGHKVRSWGFPAQAPAEGHLGFGEIGDLLPATDARGAHLQLTDANDLTTGFSGGPVLDEVTGLVIGMLTEITAPDAYERGLSIAYATPTSVLRGIMPELAERDVCPYRGLEPFTAEHAQWFQGRSEAVRQILANLSRQRRLTLLLGPSGSGKSSLIQAGVLPALAAGELPGSDRWLPVLARPRRDMLGEIERAGLPGSSEDGIIAAINNRLATEPSFQRVLLVIDQFEELLMQSADGRLRDLLTAIDEVTSATDAYTKVTVILIMRDDFYPQLAALAPRLLETAMPGLLNVPGTLSQRDLHEIIVLPAEDVRLRFQPGLPERIIGDVLDITPEAALTRQAPVTVLPLLEMTLSQLWHRRQDGYLTHEAYRRIGEVSGSVTTWCDNALDELSPEQQVIARRALTSLVHPADPSHNITPVRTQVPLHELRDLAADPGDTDEQTAVDAVIATLTRRRIITTQTQQAPRVPGAPPGEPVAELIHEALIRDWGALRQWVDQDHRFQEWLARTRERQARWAAQKDPDDLLRGTALGEALEWSQQRRLPADIAEFLTASKQHQRAAIRRSRRLNAVLAVLLALALVAAGGAVWQWRTLDDAREAALSRQLAAQAGELIDLNPELASLLAVKAYRTSSTSEAAEILRSAAALPEHRRLAGHSDGVRSVAFSRDGRTLATGSADGKVGLWDVHTGKTRRMLTERPERPDSVTSVAFSPTEDVLATATTSGKVRLRDAHTGDVTKTLPDEAASLAFSPDGNTLAIGGTDRKVRLWDTATRKRRATLVGNTGAVRSVAFSDDNRLLATAGGAKVRVWDVGAEKPRRDITEHTAVVSAVAFKPASSTLATAAEDFTVRLWDAETGQEQTKLANERYSVYSLAFSPDGSVLAAGSSYGTTRLWDVATQSPGTVFSGHGNEVTAVAFSPDSRTLATASRDKTARLWDVAADKRRTHYYGLPAPAYWVTYSPDGRTIAAAGADQTVHLWDARTGKPRTPLRGHIGEVYAVAFSSNSRALATAGHDKTVRLWDLETGEGLGKLTGHTEWVNAVSFSPDGETLASASADQTIRLWDLETGKTRERLIGHTAWVDSVAFSADGETLASGSGDSTVMLWDPDTGKPRAEITAHTGSVTSVTFSPDSRRLATASTDRTARLWDAETGEPLAALHGHGDWVTAVAFRPDGRTLATASDDQTVRLWDAESGKGRTILTGHTDWVHSVAFSPDGDSLASVSDDKAVRRWDVSFPEPDAAIRKVCHMLERDLTDEERAAYLPDDADPSVCP